MTDDVPTLVVLDNLKDILDREWSIDTRKSKLGLIIVGSFAC